MSRSALLGSPSVWMTKDFKRCTRDQGHQDKIRILSVDHLELLDAVLKNLEKHQTQNYTLRVSIGSRNNQI